MSKTSKQGSTVFVGLSGGVDSSVTAALLKQQGYKVVGVYMKNWTKDLPGFPCPWKDDYQDAKRVAVQLGVDFELFDFETPYKQKVVDYMIDGFKAGITPNPDIMCNQEIKFKLFLDTALERGADFIATGHYARIETSKQASENRNKKPITNYNLLVPRLCRAKDTNKDQTYFLYRVTKEALAKTLFPLGGYTKPEVRELAKKFGLVTATKRESMGICFVGKVGIKEFLQQYVKTEPGNVFDKSGKMIGEHAGALFYTIGQRHGLNLGGGLPYYVTGKDMSKNEVYVTTNLDDEHLWRDSFTISSLHWISNAPAAAKIYRVRTRHRGPLTRATIEIKNKSAKIILEDSLRALSPGQSAVIYDDEHVLGGGIII